MGAPQGGDGGRCGIAAGCRCGTAAFIDMTLPVPAGVYDTPPHVHDVDVWITGELTLYVTALEFMGTTLGDTAFVVYTALVVKLRPANAFTAMFSNDVNA